MNSGSILFSPIRLRGAELVNRIVMSPMTRSRSPRGVPGRNVVDYYRRRSEGEAGLIITECTAVDHRVSSNDPDIPNFFGQESLAGWRSVVETVHSAGGRIIPQLWHAGSLRKPSSSPDPELPSVGPSGMRDAERSFGPPMTEEQIQDVVDAFGRSAVHAYEMGCDGIEIHGGHGYLIDQFLWTATNRRTDSFGLANRSRFAAEIVRTCRKAIGENLPIFFRLSQWKRQDYSARLCESPEELETLLGPLVEAGVDVFDCSTRRFWTPEFSTSPLTLAGWARKLSSRRTMAVGSVGLDPAKFFDRTSSETGPNISTLERMMENEEIDLVAVGRAHIADPEWAAKVRRGQIDDLQQFSNEHLAELH